MTPDQEKPKDLKERAERILYSIKYRGDMTHDEFVLAELRAVAEEATVDMFENMKQAKAEGVRIGLERAAKILEAEASRDSLPAMNSAKRLEELATKIRSAEAGE